MSVKNSDIFYQKEKVPSSIDKVLSSIDKVLSSIDKVPSSDR